MPQENLKSSLEQVPGSLPEQLPTGEKSAESSKVEEILVVQPTTAEAVVVPNKPVVPSPVAPLTPRQSAIDNVLEDGLAEIYVTLSPEKKQELKQAGEQTVRQIDQLLDHAKTQINKIISLIRRFLLIIPGVNRFFLEQEVKIKTDKIMDLKDK
jgi:hypothetical protein